MSFQEEARAKLRRQASKQAIDLAMQGRWQEAVAANKALLENFPGDVDACNRLARAYMELGEYKLAREAYQRAVGIDPYNTIARRNLERLSLLGEAPAAGEAVFEKVELQQFIEEVGKSGVVNLVNLASPEVLARMVAGNKVSLKVAGSNLLAENSKGEYLGQVKSRHGLRLIKLMAGGNQYSASIVRLDDGLVTIIIREVYQDPSQAGRLSFSTQGSGSQRPGVESRIGELMLKRETDSDEAPTGEADYTIIGGDKPEFLSEEALDAAGDDDEDEE